MRETARISADFPLIRLRRKRSLSSLLRCGITASQGPCHHRFADILRKLTRVKEIRGSIPLFQTSQKKLIGLLKSLPSFTTRLSSQDLSCLSKENKGCPSSWTWKQSTMLMHRSIHSKTPQSSPFQTIPC